MAQRKTKERVDRVVVPLQGSWTAIPNDLLRDKSLTPEQRMLGTLLYVYAGNTGQSFPPQKELAELLGVERRTVQRWLVVLKQKHYISPQRKIYGNVYILQEPNKILTNATPGSHASLLSQTHDLDSSSSESPPTLPEEEGHAVDSIRAGQTPTGKYLESRGIVAWKKLQEMLKDVPLQRIQERVESLVLAGKETAYIVYNLKHLGFSSDVLQPAALPRDRAYWQERGFTFGGDDDQADEQCPERGDPELAQWFKETGI